MAKRCITQHDGAPVTKAPISQAVVVGNHCWTSGQVSLDEKGCYKAGSVRDEAERCFQRIFQVIEAAGFSREDIVLVNIDFKSLGDLAEINHLFCEFFPEGKRPARNVNEVAAVPLGAKVKIQAIAARA